MAFTKRDVVLRAFRAIGLAAYTFDLRPEELQDALAELEQMIALWASRGIVLSYNMGESPDADLDDDSGLSAADMLPVVQNLGLSLAGMFGKQPTPIQMANAAQSYGALLADAALQVDASRPVRGGVPYGAGNKPFRTSGVFIDTDSTAAIQQRRDNGDLVIG